MASRQVRMICQGVRAIRGKRRKIVNEDRELIRRAWLREQAHTARNLAVRFLVPGKEER
jgi:hypothetical protein